MKDFIPSLKKNYKGIILISTAAFFTSIGQLFWKLSVNNNIYFLILGFFLYGLGAIIVIISFRYGSFSVLHPMLCLSYIFAIIFGFIFLREPIGIIKISGIVFIMLGVVFIGGGDD